MKSRGPWTPPETTPKAPPAVPRSKRATSFKPPAKNRKVAGNVALAFMALLAIAVGSLSGLMLVYSVNLPQIQDLERYRPDTTTELYDVHGRMFGSFALERRVVVGYDGFSPLLRQAVISIEDKNFESHWGVNVFRVIGAVYHDITSKGRAQGASTLTMQLARNLFLSNERTAGRKLQEIFLSLQIEHAFTKQQIFTLYGNQIYLGHGTYGFEAGAEYYFSKHAKDLTLPEAALLAGLPKGPSEFSPILNPDRALRRRNMVINAMLEDGAITAAQADASRTAPLGLHIEAPPNSVAPWFVEEVRRELERRFGSDRVHEAGLKVDTTLDLDLQQTANHAVLDGLVAYERRHGWKGRLLNVIAGGLDLNTFKHPDWNGPAAPGSYIHALVTGILPYQVTAKIGNQDVVLTPEDWAWTGFKTAPEFLHLGDIIYVHLAQQAPAGQNPIGQNISGQNMAGQNVTGSDGGFLTGTLEQDSGAEGSLLAMDNSTGDVLALVGGRDFNLSQFDRATQSERQTGSSFKPYVYTAAVEAGATPEEMILDAPTSFGSYTPHNYEGNYLGEITLEKAFADSRNIPALKLAQRVGIRKVIETAHQFGVTSNIPPFLPVALGSVEVTLLEHVAAYSVFPNDGIRIAPRLIRRVTTADGIPLTEPVPEVKEVISTKTARTMMLFLKSVIAPGGTGQEAAALHHALGGKTGTTSDFTDAWFMGFSPSVTCGVWVGYDSRQSLGDKETGAHAALPIWMDFMKQAIAGKPNEQFPGDMKAPGLPVATHIAAAGHANTGSE